MNGDLGPNPASARPFIAVVIPCYQVARSIGGVLAGIGPAAGRIYCIDDASTDETTSTITRRAEEDSRVLLISRPANGGVGAAVMDGYRAATADGADVIVKIDGDGQMDSSLIEDFVAPILLGEADYVKGNRFFSMQTVRSMPASRLWGNAMLSFLSKLSSGYWDLFDPTNGFTAIHGEIARLLPLDQIHPRYFFESDMLFRLSIIRACVRELPVDAVYAGEVSHLSVTSSLFTFPLLHSRNLAKRIVYNYFLRNFSLASLNLVIGTAALLFGVIFGAWQWVQVGQTGEPATAGTVMLSALPIIIGVQLVLNFLAYDMASIPSDPLHRRIARGNFPVARRISSQRVEND